MNRTLAYWLCQFGGWGAFLGINLITRIQLHGSLDWGYSAMVGFAAGVGMALSHLFRITARPKDWTPLSLRRLIPRILLFSLLGAAILVILIILLGHFVKIPEDAREDHSLQLLLLQTLNWTLVYCGWGTLYFAIRFFEAFQQTQLEKWQIQATAREAELKSLKSQLNPHFLFNCLNSLRGMISEDPEKAQQMVTQLASLLRYALQSNTEPEPLREELRAVRNYLELEAIRLEERLQYDFQVDEACLQLMVPPLLVQSLVENGIKHGLANLRAGGNLLVVASCNSSRFLIDVINSGGEIAEKRGDGVGLRNAASRLELIYGPDASLQLSQKEPNKIRARINIPLKGRDDAGGAG